MLSRQGDNIALHTVSGDPDAHIYYMTTQEKIWCVTTWFGLRFRILKKCIKENPEKNPVRASVLPLQRETVTPAAECSGYRIRKLIRRFPKLEKLPLPNR